jgi:hypothetical protein
MPFASAALDAHQKGHHGACVGVGNLFGFFSRRSVVWTRFFIRLSFLGSKPHRYLLRLLVRTTSVALSWGGHGDSSLATWLEVLLELSTRSNELILVTIPSF